MILGNKSDLKKHLSVKRPTWAHKVVVHSPLEHNQEMERREESFPDRDAPLKTERSEPMQSRY
jgi:hypothetical protein